MFRIRTHNDFNPKSETNMTSSPFLHHTVLSTPIPLFILGLDLCPCQSQDGVSLVEWGDLDFLWKLSCIAWLAGLSFHYNAHSDASMTPQPWLLFLVSLQLQI